MNQIIPFETSKLFDVNYSIPVGCQLTVNQGGSSSGKTYSILQVLFLKAISEPKIVITVTGQDLPNLKKGAIRDASTIVSSSSFVESQIRSYNKSEFTYYFNNGSIIEFTSYQDFQDAKNGKRHYLFVNECNGVNYEIFEQLFIRTSIHTWLDYNPSSEFWLHEKKVLERPYTRFIKSTYKHNPFISDTIKNTILSYKPTEANKLNGTADAYMWDVYGLGNMGVLEGVLFPKHELKYYNDVDISKIEYYFGYIDIADTGDDDHCCIISGNINDDIYILDVVYTKSDVETNSKMTAELINKYNPEFCQIEINMGGTMYPTILRPLINQTTLIPIRNSTNKQTRIFSVSSKIKKHCHFKRTDDYQYNAFMKNLTEYQKDGKSKHDDAPDSLAGLVNFLIQNLSHLYQ